MSLNLNYVPSFIFFLNCYAMFIILKDDVLIWQNTYISFRKYHSFYYWNQQMKNWFAKNRRDLKFSLLFPHCSCGVVGLEVGQGGASIYIREPPTHTCTLTYNLQTVWLAVAKAEIIHSIINKFRFNKNLLSTKNFLGVISYLKGNDVTTIMSYLHHVIKEANNKVLLEPKKNRGNNSKMNLLDISIDNKPACSRTRPCAPSADEDHTMRHTDPPSDIIAHPSRNNVMELPPCVIMV